MSKLQIGIAGGSIAGCSAAVELSRRGHSVQIFERSAGELVGRGAGIGTPTSLFDKLVDRDLVDEDMPRFHAAYHPLVSKSDGTTRVFDLVLFADGYQSLGRRYLEKRCIATLCKRSRS